MLNDDGSNKNEKKNLNLNLIFLYLFLSFSFFCVEYFSLFNKKWKEK